MYDLDVVVDGAQVAHGWTEESLEDALDFCVNRVTEQHDVLHNTGCSKVREVTIKVKLR